eukprot:3941901-Rhodomonas_salina.1
MEWECHMGTKTVLPCPGRAYSQEYGDTFVPDYRQQSWYKQEYQYPGTPGMHTNTIMIADWSQ